MERSPQVSLLTTIYSISIFSIVMVYFFHWLSTKDDIFYQVQITEKSSDHYGLLILVVSVIFGLCMSGVVAIWAMRTVISKFMAVAMLFPLLTNLSIGTLGKLFDDHDRSLLSSNGVLQTSHLLRVYDVRAERGKFGYTYSAILNPYRLKATPDRFYIDENSYAMLYPSSGKVSLEKTGVTQIVNATPYCLWVDVKQVKSKQFAIFKNGKISLDKFVNCPDGAV